MRLLLSPRVLYSDRVNVAALRLRSGQEGDPPLADLQVFANYPLERGSAEGRKARIIAAATEVHHTLGPGFEEVICQRALAVELPAHDLEFSREAWMDGNLQGREGGAQTGGFPSLAKVVNSLGNNCRKARGEPSPEIYYPTFARVPFVQALSYLNASGYQVGLLLNFGARKLQIKRSAN